MKKILIPLLCLIILPTTVNAADASLFLSSSAGTWQTGKPFTARVMVNSLGTYINAAEGKLKFDPKFIQVTKLNTDKSIFSLWTTKPVFDNKTGEITFGGGIPGGKFRDSAGLVMDIELKPIKSGTSGIDVLASSSQVLTADGLGKNICKDFGKYYYYFGSLSDVSRAGALAKKFSGRIFLQVEDLGKAWYVFPTDNRRYYLGRPEDAFNVMRKLGLGATHKYITTYKDKTFPKSVSGKILLDVEANGEAYYVNPVNLKGYYLGRPADAFKIMRELGLGIKNSDLMKIDDWAI